MEPANWKEDPLQSAERFSAAWVGWLGFPGLREISKHLKILCIAIPALLKGSTAAACSVDSLHVYHVKRFCISCSQAWFCFWLGPGWRGLWAA